MNLEEVLQQINGFGPFQVLCLVLVCFSRTIIPCHFLLNNVIGVVPPHRCAVGSLRDAAPLRNLTVEEAVVVRVPRRDDGSFTSCEMFAQPQWDLLSNSSQRPHAPTVPCRAGWVYEHSPPSSTLATEWDLVCDRESLIQTTNISFFVGVTLGSVVFGFLGDKFGRRKTILVSYILSLLMGFGSAFANSYILFTVLRFFTGFALIGFGIIASVLCVEWVDTRHRWIVGLSVSVAWSVGNLILSGLAYLITDWRTFIMTITAPIGLSLLTWWWIPESARWLLTHGDVEKAELYLDKCAKFNRRERLSPDDKQHAFCDPELVSRQDKLYTYLDLVRTPKMRRLALVTGFLWYGVASTYYGISLNITGFGLNPYLTNLVYAAVEFPAKFLVYFLLGRIGRKKCQLGAQLLTGACILINILVPEALWQARSLLAILGKGLSEASFSTLFLYSAELYPTVVRQNGLGFCNFLARLGVCLAPLILLLKNTWTFLPQLLFGCLAICSGLTVLLLPETLRVRLPETLEDIEAERTSPQCLSNMKNEAAS